REVVAEAMTDVLPDSHFVENLAQNHKSIFTKMAEKLREFAENIRQYFTAIGTNRSREANTLKEQLDDTVRYVDSIVKLFDSAAEQAVENFQKAYAVDEAAVTQVKEENDGRRERSKANQRSDAGPQEEIGDRPRVPQEVRTDSERAGTAASDLGQRYRRLTEQAKEYSQKAYAVDEAAVTQVKEENDGRRERSKANQRNDDGPQEENGDRPRVPQGVRGSLEEGGRSADQLAERHGRLNEQAQEYSQKAYAVDEAAVTQVKEENNGRRSLEEDSGSNAGTQADVGEGPRVPQGVREDSEGAGRSADQLAERHGRLKKQSEEYQLEFVVDKASDWPAGKEGIPAYCKNGVIHILESAPSKQDAKLIPHEATHAMKQLAFKPYLDFLETVPERNQL
ncbi:MAG: hypothetical protein PUA63_07955, partial [Oscillospiraceae bacterium]|nr:hypothetical protein [Oscillospiraceae bacterium]